MSVTRTYDRKNRFTPAANFIFFKSNSLKLNLSSWCEN
jgi:hypothetical protein